MEYSDGSDAVEVGDHLSVDGQSLGSATYDADGDGIADSVIVGQEDTTIVFTDTDGDGYVDTQTAYDSDGNVIGGGSGYDTGDTGDSGADQTGTDATVGTDTGTDGTVGTDTGYDDTDPGDTGYDDTGYGDDTGDSGYPDSAVSLVVVNSEGQTVDIGAPTHDMDGDGTLDTSVVTNGDGSTTGYTDRNGDGVADQATVIGADGTVVISIVDDNGGWDVVSTGHLDAAGNYVEDQAGYPDTGTGVEVDQGGTSDDIDAGTSGITYTDASGQTYELGEPSVDMDGDGTADTVVTTLEDGTIVGYTDADGDGRTDQVIQIDPDGTVTIGVPDGQGGWEQAASGSLGLEGEFVPAG